MTKLRDGALEVLYVRLIPQKPASSVAIGNQNGARWNRTNAYF